MLLEIENKTMVSVSNYDEFVLRMKLELSIYGKDEIELKCRRSNLTLLQSFVDKLRQIIDKNFKISEF